MFPNPSLALQASMSKGCAQMSIGVCPLSWISGSHSLTVMALSGLLAIIMAEAIQVSFSNDPVQPVAGLAS